MYSIQTMHRQILLWKNIIKHNTTYNIIQMSYLTITIIIIYYVVNDLCNMAQQKLSAQLF